MLLTFTKRGHSILSWTLLISTNSNLLEGGQLCQILCFYRSRENQQKLFGFNVVILPAMLNAHIQRPVFLQIFFKSFILIYSSGAQHLAFTKNLHFSLVSSSSSSPHWTNICTFSHLYLATLFIGVNRTETWAFHFLTGTNICAFQKFFDFLVQMQWKKSDGIHLGLLSIFRVDSLVA